jgi:hypothetical protein
MKNLNDTSRIETRDLSSCSSVLEPTAPPLTPIIIIIILRKHPAYNVRMSDNTIGLQS